MHVHECNAQTKKVDSFTCFLLYFLIASPQLRRQTMKLVFFILLMTVEFAIKIYNVSFAYRMLLMRGKFCSLFLDGKIYLQY